MRSLLTKLALLIAPALLLACSSSDPAPTPTLAPTETPTPVPTATPVHIPTPVRPEARPFPESLRQSSDALLEQIAAVRGTPLKAPVDMFLLTREQAREFYSDTGVGSSGGDGSGGNGASGGRAIDVRQEVYELLALIPERNPTPAGAAQPPSLQESQVDNLISLITGFYSPEHNALYVVDSATSTRSTIVHELTHALQYQYVDLAEIERRRRNDWDATTALLDVLEGDAVNTEIEVLGFSTRESYRNPACFTIPAAQRAGTPYVVERELDTWYEDGLCFVQSVAAERGIEALFANLPVTTEQVLHPEKYFAGEGRLPVQIADLTSNLGAGWRRASGGTFGEFMVQNILLAGLPNSRPQVQMAAAGWGGDAWSLYVSGESRLLQFQATWDTPEDAGEFWSTLLASLATQGAATPDEGSTTFELTLGSATWRANLNGASTSFILTNDPSVLPRLPATP